MIFSGLHNTFFFCKEQRNGRRKKRRKKRTWTPFFELFCGNQILTGDDTVVVIEMYTNKNICNNILAD